MRRWLATTLALAALVAGLATGRVSAPSGAKVEEWGAQLITTTQPGLTRDVVQVVTREVREHIIYRPPKPYPAWPKIAGKLDWPPITGKIVAVRGSCRLDSGAAASLAHVEASLGYHIWFSSCYRSYAQQAAAYAAKPWLAAPPGHSLHERGLAIDVKGVTEEIRRVLGLHGWSQFNAAKEPWHFSYRLVG